MLGGGVDDDGERERRLYAIGAEFPYAPCVVSPTGFEPVLPA